jgi:hypothetical protein
MKAQRDEGGGRILLEDNTGGGKGSFSVLEFGFQLDLLVYTCVCVCVCVYLKILNTQLQFTQNLDLCRIYFGT